jgi:hypothetical protein
MSQHEAEVTYLKKIHLSIVTGSSSESIDGTGKPIDHDFIFGVGKDGITAFEKTLFGKKPGEEIALEVKSDQLNEVFGHLKNALQNFLPSAAVFSLKARVNSISTPDDREVVSAIAGSRGEGGCDCGCDCA